MPKKTVIASMHSRNNISIWRLLCPPQTKLRGPRNDAQDIISSCGWREIIAFFTLLCFTTTTILWAAPVNPSVSILPEEIAQSSLKIVPKELGTVQDFYQ